MAVNASRSRCASSDLRFDIWYPLAEFRKALFTTSLFGCATLGSVTF